ncbi:MAG: NACHT domain-containing protein [Acidobacteriota bacterium]|nr:NACHT domain-containing protein [Acidobacteriota bacterium]
MLLESLFEKILGWLWQQYGKNLSDKAFAGVREKWENLFWSSSEKKYRKQLAEAYSITRLLGFSYPINIYKIFVEPYLNVFQSVSKERIGIESLLQYNRILILGKAGSGKTTLLRHFLVLASQEKIKLTPVFISLGQWTRVGNISLHEFIVREFEIYGFVNSKPFVEQKLKDGQILILLDGLDEIPFGTREKAIQEILDFERRYSKSYIVLTARDSLEYVFERFFYFELSGFDTNQIRLFLEKWFSNHTLAEQFWLDLLASKDSLELARVPLLLAFLCIIYQRTKQFPQKVTDLLQQVLDILLQKWDSSRLINRENPVHSPAILQDLLSSIAFHIQVHGSYLFHRDFLLKVLHDFGVFDATEIKKLMEVILSSGLIHEENHNFFVFFHTSIREYLVAYNLLRNQNNFRECVPAYAHEQSWENVWLMLASLFDNLGQMKSFYEIFFDGINQILLGEQKLVSLVRWSNQKAEELGRNTVVMRAFLIYIAISVECARSIRIALDASRPSVRALSYARIRAYTLLSVN